MTVRKEFMGEIKSFDDNDMIIRHSISSLSVDRDGEVLVPKGCIVKNYLNNPVVAFAHDYYTPAVGKNIKLEVNDNEIIAETMFADTKLGQELYYLYKEGFMKAWSVGFIPITVSDKRVLEGQKGRTYEKWELLEYSSVVVPSNPTALTLAVQKGLQVDETLKIINSERLKSGRVISESNRQKIKDALLSIEIVSKSLQELLDISEPPTTELLGLEVDDMAIKLKKIVDKYKY